MSTELIECCRAGVFPSMDTMSQFGMDGHGGTDPIDIFECYKLAISGDTIMASDLEGGGSLSTLILSTLYILSSNFSMNQ